MEGPYQPLHSLFFILSRLNLTRIMDEKGITPEIAELESKAKEMEREAIVDYIRSRIGFWNSNSNVNKKIKLLADKIEDEAHHRIKQDK